MNRPELYQKTITTLNNAWREGILLRGDCEACAVGNILQTGAWKALFCTLTNTEDKTQQQHIADEGKHLVVHLWGTVESIQPDNERRIRNLIVANEAIAQSGYTKKELIRVEYAFETAAKVEGVDRQNQYNGLCAVFDVLQDIHQVDFSIHQESKEALESVYSLLN